MHMHSVRMHMHGQNVRTKIKTFSSCFMCILGKNVQNAYAFFHIWLCTSGYTPHIIIECICILHKKPHLTLSTTLECICIIHIMRFSLQECICILSHTHTLGQKLHTNIQLKDGNAYAFSHNAYAFSHNAYAFFIHFS